MTKYLIGVAVCTALVAVIAVIVIGHHAPPANPPDLDRQVNEVARNLHPTKLNP